MIHNKNHSQAVISYFCLQVSFHVKFVFAVRSQEGQAYRLLANCLDKLNAPEEELDGDGLTWAPQNQRLVSGV